MRMQVLFRTMPTIRIPTFHVRGIIILYSIYHNRLNRPLFDRDEDDSESSLAACELTERFMFTFRMQTSVFLSTTHYAGDR